MKVDFYFSYRSPYSYFILPRLKKLIEEYDVDVNFRLVYPLAIRKPSFFKNKKYTDLLLLASIGLSQSCK